VRLAMTRLALLVLLEGQLARAEEAQPATNTGVPAPEREAPAPDAVKAVQSRPPAARKRRRDPAAESPPVDHRVRVTLEVIFGLTGSLGGTLGVLIPAINARSEAPVAAAGALTAAVFGSWFGTALGGVAFGGKGHVGYAFLGALAGGGLALVAVIPAVIGQQNNDTSLLTPALVTGVFAPVLGAILGYELSWPSDPDSTTAPPIQLMPSISLTTGGRGGTVGIAGTF
jgi:hypothetical protein